MTHKLAFLLLFFTVPASLRAESGYKAWLRYSALDDSIAARSRQTLPGVLVAFGNQLPVQSARQELADGIRGMLGRTLRYEPRLTNENAVVIGTLEDLRRFAPEL